MSTHFHLTEIVGVDTTNGLAIAGSFSILYTLQERQGKRVYLYLRASGAPSSVDKHRIGRIRQYVKPSDHKHS